MSGSGTANGPGADFAELLRELKERSGLSYGVLAKRLHMSTSTLHRYCNGDAVPTDYAPVERLARLCGATPEELVELHRTWVLADAVRRRKGSADKGGATAGMPEEGSVAEAGESAAPETQAESESEPVIGGGASGRAGERVPARRRTRVALVAGVAVAAVLGAVTLAVSLPSGGTEDGAGRTSGAASAGGDRAEGTAEGSPSPSDASASVSASESAGKGDEQGNDKGEGEKGVGASASATSTGPGGAGGGGADASRPVPLTVKVSPYTWESPCSQRYLVDRPRTEVAPPPPEQDAAGWVASEGAVSSGKQFLTLTLQGTGEETVVVRSLKVRMAGRQAPLAWNDYAMGYPGVGCGAGVPTRSFTIALDAARPDVQPKAGSRDFPYSVSESDPEVYYITADASAYYVSWYLELEWSSGDRGGTLIVNDDGRPFRTSGNNGRPAYEYPLGGPKWVPEGTTLGDGGEG
ncbi:helix-turn-helix domain-containing protein [Streptomyces phaeolivaceus]|uniref:helix-turn-helix domain-containing protein n=1 Tax=Streptomyces phaeolivaceus TaxID=2653200 RepID=UPI001D03881B|nr:helix-turn-helix transcriptional regulator [Streptomyces phaeolivaceus]